MLSLSGGALATFIGGTIEVGFKSPAANGMVQIGVFDPNSAGLWDDPTLDLKFEIFADPNNDGTGASLVFGPLFSTDPDAVAAENMWLDKQVANVPAAKNATSGDYFYFLRITPVTPNPNPGSINGIKVRTDGTFSLTGQTIQFVAKANTLEELNIIGGFNPCPSASTYDGSWEFEFEVKPNTISLELWDGDFDFGSNAGPEKDTDDPNTGPPANVCVDTNGVGTLPDCINPSVPLWAQGGGVNPEGVANGGVGDPQDDNTICAFRRSPGVTYRLLPPGAPNNGGFLNANPSGNSEWEKFLISTNPGENPDYVVPSITPGKWRLRIEGMDVFNQFALHFNKALAPEACLTCTGRMTGGGSIFLDNGDRVTHGFEMHCDPKEVPNNLEINWGKKPENNFHLEQLNTGFCFDDPSIDQKQPKTNFDTFVGTGTGRLNGIPGATIKFTLQDAGEPGKDDTWSCEIKNSGGTVVLSFTARNLKVGNQQAH